MIDESFGDEDEVDQNFYGRSSASPTSKLLNSVPLGEWIFSGQLPAVVLPFFNFFALQVLLWLRDLREPLQVRHLGCFYLNRDGRLLEVLTRRWLRQLLV